MVALAGAYRFGRLFALVFLDIIAITTFLQHACRALGHFNFEQFPLPNLLRVESNIGYVDLNNVYPSRPLHEIRTKFSSQDLGGPGMDDQDDDYVFEATIDGRSAVPDSATKANLPDETTSEHGSEQHETNSEDGSDMETFNL